ncbi:MAG: SMC-Scp complex subunit ScpB [Leptolyngbya sp. SIOISBB]|nr:SMC-Scp complex subunit ScpB [Leptolyngbya sp. SIOISBB]
MPKLASVIEAILYLKGRPLNIAHLAEHAGCDREMAEEGLMELMNEYAHRESALEIVETKDGYCLQLKSGFRHLVDTLIPLDLGVGALRTLAAIALRGPIAQTDLIDIRGSGAYQHVGELVGLGFVRKRRQSDGRSFWLQVTNKFHQHFEIDDLPTFTKPQPQSTETSVSDDEKEGQMDDLPPTSVTSEATVDVESAVNQNALTS